MTAMSLRHHITPQLLFVAIFLGLFLSITGCQRGVWSDIHRWMDETRKQATPQDVSTALVPFFLYEGQHDIQLHLIWITNRLPELVTSLPIFSADPTNIDVECRDDRNELDLTIGSGFGHWGLVVLRPGYNEDFSGRPDCILWGDGVYFYDQYK